MQNSTNATEISEISPESPENRSQQNLGTEIFQAIRPTDNLPEYQIRVPDESARILAEYRRNQETLLAERLRREQFFLGASEVLHPPSGCLRDLIRSTSTRLKNNPLSATVLCFFAITAEVISGVAINCYKFSNNEMNGFNISETNILKNATKTKEDCMEEKLSYAIPAVFFLGTLAVVGIKLYENAQEEIRGRRVISDSNVRETSTAIPPSEVRLDQARHVNADLVLNNSEPNSRNI